MNSLIAIRNNVIHQDATPSLTHLTVDEHQKIYKNSSNL